MEATLPPLSTFFEVDEELLHKVLGAAMEHGADFCDLYFEHSQSSSIGMEDGIISRAQSSVDRGVGIRVVVGDQVGYSFSEHIALEPMLDAARTAASIARGGGAPGPVALKTGRGHDLYQARQTWDQVGIDQKLPLLQKAEAWARAADPHVEKVNLAWADGDKRVLIATSDGAVFEDHRPMGILFATVTMVEDGEVQTNHGNLAGRRDLDWFSDARVKEMIDDLVARTKILYEARRPPAGELPVVLSAGASGILLHEAVGHGMEADFNRKGTSIYSSLLNESVAPPEVTIVDSALHEGERGALNVDDEGSPTERTVLVEGGIMRTYLHDRISAAHFGLPSTGSGRRQSFRHTPMPRMRCTYMENGPHERDEIIRSVKRGIVCDHFANGQVEIGAGDFTFYVKNGWLIEDGKLSAPIKDVNIIGNGPEALRRIQMVAGDMKLDTGGWTCGKEGQGVPVSQGMPTVLVSSLTVGGEDA